MAEVLPTHSPASINLSRDHGPAPPLPNPPFVFPAQPDNNQNYGSNELGNPARPSSVLDVAGPQNSRSATKPQRLSLNALPAFDFGPAASNPTTSTSSPSRSPSRRTPPVIHAGGHRRNGSEYVGGDIAHGGPMLVSSSPTKNDYFPTHRRNGSEVVLGDGAVNSAKPIVPDTQVLPNQQPISRLGPPVVKRGHAHRRSGAISSHDLSSIVKPLSETKPGSAPSTPLDPIFPNAAPPNLDRSASQPVLSSAAQEDITPQSQPDKIGSEAPPRPRARFSERVDYIERPLSTISSETSSSMSTIRANHSVSNSISSVVNPTISSSPPDVSQTPHRGQTSHDMERDQAKSRLKTAESRSRSSSGDWERTFSHTETSAKRPSSAPSCETPSKRTEASGEIFVRDQSAATQQPLNDVFAKPTSMNATSPSAANTRTPGRRAMSPTTRPRTSPEPKVTKRQRKGRSWAGLLSRKAKDQNLKENLGTCRSPTPPLRQARRQPSPIAELSFDDINFDDDTTYIMETASPPYVSRPRDLKIDQATFNTHESHAAIEADSSAPILDIDAAMGSLDNSSGGPSFDDVIGGGSSSSVKRPMHSSGVVGGFVGPGMHYHRRADSAPEVDAIDRSRFGFPRLGSNPAMAIEEEEEEEDEEDIENDRSSALHQASQDIVSIPPKEEVDQPPLGINIVEADPVDCQPMLRTRRRPANNDDSKQDHRQALDPVDIVGADEEPRFSVVTKSSDGSTITPTLSPEPLDPMTASVPAETVLPMSTLSYEMPDTPSATSCSEFRRSSFEGPRMHTATSSITDRTTLSSSRAGDHGPGYHGSIDDVPSLTSSASTMSAHPARFSSSGNSGGDRASSLSAAVPARTRPASSHKRLSLASLSRLAGSSYNKSKLNIEETAPVDITERTEKKKGNRMSRMMKFWKSKEKLSSA